MRTDLFGPQHELTLGTTNTLAEVLKDRGIYREAASLYEAIETTLRSTTADDAQSRRHLASVISNRARLLEQLDRTIEARALMDDAISVLSADTDDPTSSRLLLFAQGHAAGLDSALGQCQTAATDMRAVHAGIVDSFGPSHPATNTSRTKLAQILLNAGEVDEAIDRLSEIPQSARTTLDVTLLASAYARRHGLEEARALLQSADIPPFDRSYTEAGLLMEANLFTESDAVLEPLDLQSLSELDQLRALSLRAEIELVAGNPTITDTDRMIACSTALYGPAEPMTRYCTALKAYADSDEASIRMRLSELAQAAGEHHPLTVRASMLLARYLQRTNKQGEAEELLRPLIDWSTRERGQDHPGTRHLLRIASTSGDPI
jgi:tetratricopeptide (TPR) repeat protein